MKGIDFYYMYFLIHYNRLALMTQISWTGRYFTGLEKKPR